MSVLKFQKSKIFNMFREWTESMTMHGFPNIFRTKYISIRIMWIIFFFASNGFCFFIISRILTDYFKYDVVTTIKVIEKDSMPFPAVTVCNTNSFVTEEALNYVTSYLAKNNLTGFPNVNLSGSFSGNFSKLYYTYNFIRFLTTSNSKQSKQEVLKSFSLPFEKMFISCLYNLQPCDQDVWEWYYDYFYGNCFRFNTGKNSKGENTQIKYTNMDGKYYGLMIELFVGTLNSQKTLSYANGAHIFVDDNCFKPTTNRGYDIAPGSITNLALDRIITKLLPKPYSECIENLEDIESIDSEYYRKVRRSNLTYRQSDCFDAYISDEIYKKCGCEFTANNLIVEKTPCDTYEKQFCGSDIFKKIIESNYKSKIKSWCPLECESVRYKVSKSENKYPSESYAKELLETNTFKSLFSNRSNTSFEELSSNILAVNVYYEYSEQTEIAQSATVRWDGLVASIGGTLGLFLGISVLSFAEIIDLVFQLILEKLN